MKSKVIVLGLALAITVGGNAQAKDYATNGDWTNYYLTNGVNGSTPICGMRVGTSPMALHIKWEASNPNELFVQTFKNDWVIPNGQEVNVRVGFDDKGAFGEAVALGYTGQYPSTGERFGLLTFHIPSKMVADFMGNFESAKNMWIAFPDGTEKPWNAGMTGSRDAAASFLKCINAAPRPSQPFGAAPQASQPFGKPQASQPATPPASATPTTDRHI